MLPCWCDDLRMQKNSLTTAAVRMWGKRPCPSGYAMLWCMGSITDALAGHGNSNECMFADSQSGKIIKKKNRWHWRWSNGNHQAHRMWLEVCMHTIVRRLLRCGMVHLCMNRIPTLPPSRRFYTFISISISTHCFRGRRNTDMLNVFKKVLIYSLHTNYRCALLSKMS